MLENMQETAAKLLMRSRQRRGIDLFSDEKKKKGIKLAF